MGTECINKKLAFIEWLIPLHLTSPLGSQLQQQWVQLLALSMQPTLQGRLSGKQRRRRVRCERLVLSLL